VVDPDGAPALVELGRHAVAIADGDPAQRGGAGSVAARLVDRVGPARPGGVRPAPGEFGEPRCVTLVLGAARGDSSRDAWQGDTQKLRGRGRGRQLSRRR